MPSMKPEFTMMPVSQSVKASFVTSPPFTTSTMGRLNLRANSQSLVSWPGTAMMVAALMMYAFARSIMDQNALFRLGAFHFGSSIMKNDFLNFAPVTAFTSSAQRKMSSRPEK